MNPHFSRWRSLYWKGKSSEHWHSISGLTDFKAQTGNPYHSLGGDVKWKMGTCLGQALSKFPRLQTAVPGPVPPPCGDGRRLAGHVGLATSPEPSDSWGGPGGPSFSFGKGGTWDCAQRDGESRFPTIPSSQNEWQSFNFGHSIRWDFCSQGSGRESHFVLQVFWVWSRLRKKKKSQEASIK